MEQPGNKLRLRPQTIGSP